MVPIYHIIKWRSIYGPFFFDHWDFWGLSEWSNVYVWLVLVLCADILRNKKRRVVCILAEQLKQINSWNYTMVIVNEILHFVCYILTLILLHYKPYFLIPSLFISTNKLSKRLIPIWLPNASTLCNCVIPFKIDVFCSIMYWQWWWEMDQCFYVINIIYIVLFVYCFLYLNQLIPAKIYILYYFQTYIWTG